MNTNPFYWLPLWADKDPLSLKEAAALLLNLQPRARLWKPGDSETLRAEAENVQATVSLLVQAIEAGPDAPGGLRGTVPKYQTGGRLISRATMYRPAQYEETKSHTDFNKPAIARGDLKDWAIARGMRPVVWVERTADAPHVARKVRGSAAEETADRIIAVLVCLLADRGPNTWRKGDKPNFSQIQEAAVTKAQELFSGDVRGLEACRKRLADAWKAVFKDL